MEKHLFLINNEEEYQDFEEKRNFCEDTLVKPIVGYIPEITTVAYDAHILPENKELWEKFNQVFEGHVTCEDEWLFSTHLMEYQFEGQYVEDNFVTSLKFFTKDVNPCNGDYNNPYFKATFAYLDHEDLNATINDFIGLGDDHIWDNTEACGK